MQRLLPLAAVILLGAGCVSVERLPEAAAPTDAAVASADLLVEDRIVSGTRVRILRPERPNVRLTLTRPDAADRAVLLAVPGTYTSPQDTVEGYVVLDGQIVRAKERQGWDGAVLFKDGGIAILQTDRGRTLTRAFLAQVAADGASLVQVHLLVKDAVAQPFKEQPATFRRALAVIDGGPAVVETLDPIDLDGFAALLVTLGARDAANLDMGTWSEGWYRAADGSRRILGIPHENAARQSNWVVFLL